MGPSTFGTLVKTALADVITQEVADRVNLDEVIIP